MICLAKVRAKRGVTGLLFEAQMTIEKQPLPPTYWRATAIFENTNTFFKKDDILSFFNIIILVKVYFDINY